MNEIAFVSYLMKKGKKPDVVARNVKVLKQFSTYLQKNRKKDLDEIALEDIQEYVADLEFRKLSAKGHLYVLMNYFKSISNMELLRFTAELREQRTRKTRRIFPLKDFLDIDEVHVNKLKTLKINTVEDMMKAVISSKHWLFRQTESEK